MHALEPAAPSPYRVAGALMLTSGVANLAFASIWALTFVWLCIGVYWAIPMAVAVGEIVVGGLALAGIRMRFLGIASVVGGLNGVLLINPYAAVMQLVVWFLERMPEVRTWLEEAPS